MPRVSFLPSATFSPEANISSSLAEPISPLAWIFEFFPVHAFPEMCMRVYFSDDYSAADFINVNAGLHALFWACSHLISIEPKQDDYGRFSDICGKNTEVALANLPLHLPATIDYVMALLSGVCHHVLIPILAEFSILTVFISPFTQSSSQNLPYHGSSPQRPRSCARLSATTG